MSGLSPKKRALTQQGAFRKDRRALNVAEKCQISDREIINQMAASHSEPNSAQAISQAAAAILHTRAHMRKEAPISDAVKAIVKKRIAARLSSPSDAGFSLGSQA
jgi:hypothetical protein